ncbi:uncharacterized protein PFL1_05623 [Pseudozyma flocculosa PF-1]|uniref:Inner centromere protein ARK-binding domain-containing protein n=1 Tax=Pseudozyma flocculosa PF-1 TaxID=1277687 RepID=A0A061H2M4_9BASI|nr:uncharacterized protein PFL1_05623 [Pseudozyma flocculosa PF-1]EPQ26987.1 hypothetical protein PFL1_05623 [Pseudozyma flocculosa PF-1]
MPSSRSASGRGPAASSSSVATMTVEEHSLSTGLQAAYGNLLGHVNTMRRCCDMQRLYDQLHTQGDEFIAGSIQHANDILANFASSSRLHDSPSKRAGDMIKTPSRRKDAPRTRRAAANVAAIRLRAYEESPVAQPRSKRDRTSDDKENRPAAAAAPSSSSSSVRLGDDVRATNSLQQKLLEASGKAKASDSAAAARTPLSDSNKGSNPSSGQGRPIPDVELELDLAPTPRPPARRALGEIGEPTTRAGAPSSDASAVARSSAPSASDASKSASASSSSVPSQPDASTRARAAKAPKRTKAAAAAAAKNDAAAESERAAPSDNSMEVDETLAGASMAELTMPRASTPPPPSASPEGRKPASSGMTKVVSIDDLQPIADASATLSDPGIDGDIEHTHESAEPRQGAPPPGTSEGEPSADEGEDSDADGDASGEERTAVTAEQDLSAIAEDAADVAPEVPPQPASSTSSSDAKSHGPSNGAAAANAAPSTSTAAATLPAFKAAQQPQSDGVIDKPAKRTLSSFSAKKSLSAHASSAVHAAAAAANLPALPASTPAGPGFRSSFLQKSLRKRAEDTKAHGRSGLGSADDDSDGDYEDGDQDEVERQTGAQDAREDGDDIDGEAEAELASSGAKAGPKSRLATASATRANTRVNATQASSAATARNGGKGVKRKSEESHAPLGSIADRNSPPPAKLVKPVLSRLGAKTPSHAAPISGSKVKPTPSGPAAKLEMFRSSMATYGGDGGGGGGRFGVPLSSSSAFARKVSASSPSKGLPPVPAAIAQMAPPAPASDPVAPRTDAGEATTSRVSKLYPSLPAMSPTRTQQQVDSRATPLSPKSPSQGKPDSSTSSGANSNGASPVRLPPRSASVRGSPGKSPDRSRFGSPHRSLRDGGAKSLVPGSPTSGGTALTGTRNLASLFGTPSSSRVPQRPQAAATSTPTSSPGSKVTRLQASRQASAPAPALSQASIAATAAASEDADVTSMAPPPVPPTPSRAAQAAKEAEAAAADSKQKQLPPPPTARKSAEADSAPATRAAKTSTDGVEPRQTRLSAAKAKEAERLEREGEASQPATQATQYFDALSQRPDDASGSAKSGKDSEGELTLEDLSGPGVGSGKKEDGASARPAQPVRAPAPVISVVVPSPSKAKAPPSLSASQSQAQQAQQAQQQQPNRLQGSVRGAPSAPNGRPVSQKAGVLSSSVKGKAGSSKLPTSSQPASSSSASSAAGSSSDPASGGSFANSVGWSRFKGLFSKSSANPGSGSDSSSAPAPSTGFTPRPRGMSISQQQQQQGGSNGLGASASGGPPSQEARLDASQSQSQASTASTTIGGKPASLIRADKPAAPAAASSSSSQQQQQQQQQQPRSRAGSVSGQAPKLKRTISQSSIRTNATGTGPNVGSSSAVKPSAATPGVIRPGAHVPGQPIRFEATPGRGPTSTLASSSSTAAAAAAAAQQQQQRQQQQPAQAQQQNRASTFSTQNPFQQQKVLRQQQAQQQQAARLQAEEAANARAAMAAAQHREAYAQMDEHAGDHDGEPEELPDVASE